METCSEVLCTSKKSDIQKGDNATIISKEVNAPVADVDTPVAATSQVEEISTVQTTFPAVAVELAALTQYTDVAAKIMDYKKSKAPVNTVTRNIMDLCDDTHNIYESVAIIAKRANQISLEIKQDLSKKLSEFASYNDSLEEVFENREQIEISRFYEKLPKPTLIATEEFVEKSIYWRDPSMPAHSSDEDEL